MINSVTIWSLFMDKQKLLKKNTGKFTDVDFAHIITIVI